MWTRVPPQNWDIPFYRESSASMASGGRPFMKLPLRNIPLWKRLLWIVNPIFLLLVPRTGRSERNGASYYWNYGRSDARKSKFRRFFFHRPFIVTIYCRQNAADFAAALKKRGGRPVCDPRPAIGGLGQGEQVRGKDKCGMIISRRAQDGDSGTRSALWSFRFTTIACIRNLWVGGEVSLV